jgi:hypothetical protein
MPAPITACPTCSSKDIAVLPEASIEGFWKSNPKSSISNGHLHVAIHLCMACGQVRMFANDPAAQLDALGKTVVRYGS